MARLSRQTKQKQLLEVEISKITTFFSAEELHILMQSKEKGLGIATVYRFLNEKAKRGLIHSFQCNKKTIYSTNQNNHAHFKCELCQKIIHLNINKIDFFKQSLAGDVCHFQLDVTGVCKDCLKLKKKTI
jgi:Fur family ferric uptake transcriptional regulator